MFEGASEPVADDAPADDATAEVTADGALADDDAADAEVAAADVVADAAFDALELHASSNGPVASAAAPKPVAEMNWRRVITMLHLSVGSATEISSCGCRKSFSRARRKYSFRLWTT
jgi:hypothetical protein